MTKRYVVKASNPYDRCFSCEAALIVAPDMVVVLDEYGAAEYALCRNCAQHLPKEWT